MHRHFVHENLSPQTQVIMHVSKNSSNKHLFVNFVIARGWTIFGNIYAIFQIMTCQKTDF